MAAGPKSDTQRLRAREFVLPALLFTALAIALFWPQLRDVNGLLHGGSDGFNRAWRIWWFSGGFREWGDTLWYSRSVFYPTGHALSAAELSPLNMVPAVLLSLVFGPIGGYNLTIMLSFAAAGLAAYAYARVVGMSRAGALVAGAIYSFAPYHTAHALGHLALMGMWVLPLGLICVERMAEHTTDRRLQLRWAVGLGACVGLAGWSSWYYLIIFGIALATYALARLSPRFTQAARRPWGAFVLAAGVAVLFVAPLYLLAKLTNSEGSRRWRVENQWGTSPLAYVLPSYFQAWWGRWFARLWGPRSPAEDSLFLGWTTLALAAAGAWWKKRRPPVVWSLAWMALVAFVLSLGPYLYVAGGSTVQAPWSIGSLRIVGHDAANYLNLGVPMPAMAISRLPLIAGMRAYARFGVVVLMAAAVIAGLGFDRLAARLQARRVAGGLAAAIVLLLLAVEFAPMSITVNARPTELDEWLAAQPGDGAVIWLPYQNAVGDEQMYRTIFTGKPIAFGDTTYLPEAFKESRKKLAGFPDDVSLDELRAMGVRWVVVAPDKLAEGRRAELGTATGMRQVREFDGLRVYEVK